MDTKKIFKKIMKRIMAGELIIQSVDELKMDRKAVLIGIDSDGQQRTGPSKEIYLEIKLTVIPKDKLREDK